MPRALGFESAGHDTLFQDMCLVCTRSPAKSPEHTARAIHQFAFAHVLVLVMPLAHFQTHFQAHLQEQAHFQELCRLLFSGLPCFPSVRGSVSYTHLTLPTILRV